MGDLFDFREVTALRVDLEEAPKRARPAFRKTMKRSALGVKRRMTEEFSGHKYARGAEHALEMEQRGEFSWEIGELNSAGYRWGLLAILSYGTANNAPTADFRKSLREEAPLMLHYLADDAAKATLDGPE